MNREGERGRGESTKTVSLTFPPRGTDTTEPSNIFKRACWTPSPTQHSRQQQEKDNSEEARRSKRKERCWNLRHLAQKNSSQISLKSSQDQIRAGAGAGGRSREKREIGNLINLIQIDDASLSNIHIVIALDQQSSQDALHIFPYIPCLCESCSITDDQRHINHFRETLHNLCLARSYGVRSLEEEGEGTGNERGGGGGKRGQG
jgi:hypothetical protein